MAKIFKKLPDGDKRTIRYEIRLTEKEACTIRDSALIRNLSTADFMRRACLGRRADVRYETEIILTLRDIVQSIRRLHATFVDDGIVPPTEIWEILINETLAAMLRISK